ncbi:hypothetical protein K1X76_06170 [bacterium]|nr:hypothetical protein [bacterium]
MDIPIPIAKGEVVVDKDSFEFEEEESGGNIGTVTGSFIDTTATEKVAFIYNGELQSTQTVTGTFNFTVPEELEDVPVAVTTCTNSSCSVVTEPVYFVVGAYDPIMGERPFSVFITNSNASTSDTTRAYTISSGKITRFNNKVYMSGVDSDNNPVLVSVNNDGSFNEDVISLENQLTHLSTIDGFLVGLDSVTQEIVLVAEDGTTQTLSTGTIFPDNRILEASPDGDYLASIIYADENNPVNLKVILVNVATLEDYSFTLSGDNITNIELSWLVDGALYYSAEKENGDHVFGIISLNTPGDITDLTVSESVNDVFTNYAEHDIQEDAEFEYVFSSYSWFYECTIASSGNTGLCAIHLDSDYIGFYDDIEILAGNFNVVSFDINTAETYIVVELDPGDGAEHLIGLIPLDSSYQNEIIYFGPGSKPEFSEEEDAFYYVLPVNGYNQLGYINVDDYLLPSFGDLVYNNSSIFYTEIYNQIPFGAVSMDLSNDANIVGTFRHFPENTVQICLECVHFIDGDFASPHEVGCVDATDNEITLNNDVFLEANNFYSDCVDPTFVDSDHGPTAFRAKFTLDDDTVVYSTKSMINMTVTNY